MNKDLVFNNLFKLINEGYFLEKYIELMNPQFNLWDESLFEGLELDWGIVSKADNSVTLENTGETTEEVAAEEELRVKEETAANIFNALLIGCQLFDDEDRIKRFVDKYCYGLEPMDLEYGLEEFGISREEALERLKHGFGVHFTTCRIADIIRNSGVLFGYGVNAMFTPEEDAIIKSASEEQKANCPGASKKLQYLFRGWGTGVSSYGSRTNYFWMYHTPESLSFLYGNISKRDKEDAMSFVTRNISHLSPENKKVAYLTMDSIYDRLVGEEQEVCCVLIDRDAFKYEVDYYYYTGSPVGVERRPYSSDFSALYSEDCRIDGNIDCRNLRFLRIPTVVELDRRMKEKMELGETFS